MLFTASPGEIYFPRSIRASENKNLGKVFKICLMFFTNGFKRMSEIMILKQKEIIFFVTKNMQYCPSSWPINLWDIALLLKLQKD